MMVDILVLDDEGEQIKAGSVWLEDGRIRFTAKTDQEDLLTNILNETVVVEGRKLSAKSTPEEWLEELPSIYSGSYLRAQVDPDKEHP